MNTSAISEVAYDNWLNLLNIREFFSGFLLLTKGDKVDFGCPAT
jgi:hypothetical protein